MNNEKFNTIISEQLDTCKNILTKKADEYATEQDRLHNFKIAAALQDETPVKALTGMMAKHTVSVYDMCKRHDKGIFASEEMWAEKITDSINYLLLLKAVVAEFSEEG